MNKYNDVIRDRGRFLALVLRHKPEEVGLALNEGGWANVEDLLVKMSLTQSLLDEIVETNNKKRFEYSEDKKMIRACQGHSIDVDLQLKPKKPPVFLYHGTSDKYLSSIEKEGLKSKNRNHVHLSEDRVTAEKVGKRHGGKTVILKIKAEEYQYNTGAKFYQSTNGVWLTEEVPLEYIAFPLEIKMDKTNRGFAVGEFVDKYGVKCSVQKSSLASEDTIWLGCDDANPKCSVQKSSLASEDTIWLGCDDANPKILAYHINGGVANGWVEYKVHPEASFTTRMHLTVEMAAALIPILQKFVDTGEIN